MAEQQWFAVRCVFHSTENKQESPEFLAPGEHAYEERITLWRAPSADDAIALAEAEAAEYAEQAGCEDTGLAQSYWLEKQPRQGAVAFSLVRKSQLEPEEYVDSFFDTGLEYEETLDD